MNQRLNSKDKLLLAAIDLMADKGYNGVTTKEIAAAAGVSEMTLFRHFGTKRALLEAAVDRFHYSGDMKRIFQEELFWDLRADLSLLANRYHEIMNRNRKMIQIVLKDTGLEDVMNNAQKHPRQLKEMLTNYFITMQEQGKMIAMDAETQAMTFMWMNYGAFMTHLYQAESITSITMQQFKESSVDLFVRALTP
ncbi:TetR family transcriptional regulator [Paenibacillus sp. HJL G12]|uniref:TetR family transcriptional regulator n=1 Tax=Paenibacillus dendrobii TaxID=2691084 RepID=A0A7X3ILX0_9BACL|nr:TetR/AcrR family transcriptional regulator [Paenibacillus dendrobii]MWV46364.1 TetR family transcriptional regulator [Paenibacillus dendrobii]